MRTVFSARLSPEPSLIPHQTFPLPPLLCLQGSVAPGKEQVLKVYYLPGKLGLFFKTFQVQVAYLDPVEIVLSGEGTLPRTPKGQCIMMKGEHKLSSSRKMHTGQLTPISTKSGSCRAATPTLAPLWLLPGF